MNTIKSILEHKPWEVVAWMEHIGIDGLTCESILHAMEIDEAQFSGSNELELAAYKANQLHALAVLYPGEQFKPTLRRAEVAIRAGLLTALGAAISGSPWRWNTTVQSLLATKTRKVIP